MDELVFQRALFEESVGAHQTVGGITVRGLIAGRTGDTYVFNLFEIAADAGEGTGSIRQLLQAAEAQARAAGATRVSIYGASVINKKLRDAGRIFARYGYTFERFGDGVLLTKGL